MRRDEQEPLNLTTFIGLGVSGGWDLHCCAFWRSGNGVRLRPFEYWVVHQDARDRWDGVAAQCVDVVQVIVHEVIYKESTKGQRTMLTTLVI